MKQTVVCINNEGFETSLERRKIYVALPDPEALALVMLRIIDESGEDYLFPKSAFRSIALPPPVKRAVLAS